MNPCSMRREGCIRVASCEVRDGKRSEDNEVAVDGASGGNSGAKICVGVGVDKYRRCPESGRKLFRGFSA